VVDAISAMAVARVEPTADAVGQVSVAVTLRNHSAAPASVMVLDAAPFFIRLYPAVAGTATPSFEDARGGTRLPRIIELGAGASGEIHDVVRRDALRAAGVGSGRYRVAAVLTTGERPEVPAGEITLP
jgi:hypothetical protein